ncbi:MAG TPA: M56 family metallopeptidase [Thermoguttaceae bacterium]|nr:M56 family metallopeptidase [Thermoguttaceae bacterium]
MTAPGSEWAQAAWMQLWQVTLLIAVVALVARLAARNRPHLAHALWLVVLAKCITPPVWSSPSGVFCWMLAGEPAASAHDGREASSPANDRRRDLARLASACATQRGEREAFGETGPDVVVNLRAVDESDLGAAPRASRWPGMPLVLVAGWASGTLVMLGLAGVRWAGCLRVMRRSASCDDGTNHRLVARLSRLSRRLGLRRPARLVVTRARVGPAVIGLWRPTVLLPEIIVRDKRPEELEPLLAHELVHVRRGDLWVGVLQVLAEAVWWFHPLVWWVSRLVSREAERCCDEAVVAELRCSPASYARSLLDVLERKRTLKPVPALPGVRPVDVTSRRLERIMKLGQGGHKRSPWWCWAVMLAAAAAALPGAAIVVAAGEEEAEPEFFEAAPVRDAERPNGESEPEASGESRMARLGARLGAAAGAQVGAWVDASGSVAEDSTTRPYELGELIGKLGAECGLNQEQARDVLVDLVSRVCGVPSGRMMRRGTELVVHGDDEAHARIASALETMREHRFDQIITIEARIFTGSPKSIEAIGAKWTVMPAEESAESTLPAPPGSADSPAPRLPDDTSPRPGSAKTVVEKSLPVMCEVLDEKRAGSILERMEADRRANVLAVPKVTVFNGQSAFISNLSERPFVVGIEECGRPRIHAVTEGLQVRVRPQLQDDRELRLDCGLTLSKILSVEVFDFTNSKGQAQAIQLPEVKTTQWDAGVEIALGKTLMIGGLETKDDRGRPQSMLVMLRAEKVPPQVAALPMAELPVAALPMAHSVHDLLAKYPQSVKVYDVADLVVPLVGPEGVVVGASYNEPVTGANAPEADYESLIDLIETTVAPDTWEVVGGPGTIAPLKTNLSLVVNQTQEVHEEIVDLLEQLRRMQDVQLFLETEVVRASDGVLERHGCDFASDDHCKALAPQDARRLRAVARALEGASIRRLPIAKLYNGQLAVVDLAPEAGGAAQSLSNLTVQCVISEDHRSIRINGPFLEAARVAQNGSFDGAAVVVRDGRTLLVDVTESLQAADQATAPTGRTLVLLTPRIVIQEEEERIGPR